MKSEDLIICPVFCAVRSEFPLCDRSGKSTVGGEPSAWLKYVGQYFYTVLGRKAFVYILLEKAHVQYSGVIMTNSMADSGTNPTSKRICGI